VIKLISMSFSGIGRFVEKQTIDFSSKEKLLQVDGRNENTGGSSGSGKSTIFHALDYLLGINDLPATTLQSRLTKNTISVEAELEIDGKKVILSRSKKDGLSIDVQGEVISGNVKAAEEELDRLIGIPKKIFKKMVHKQQKEGGFFLNLTAKESYDFLTKALGLESLTSKIALIDADIKRNDETMIGLQKHISILEAGLQTSKNDLAGFDLPENPSQVYIEEVQAKLQERETKITAMQSEIDDKIVQFVMNKPVKAEANTQELIQLIKKLELDKAKLENDRTQNTNTLISSSNGFKQAAKATEGKLAQIPYLRNQITKIASEMKSFMEQKAHIEKSQCPTCMQNWAGDSAQGKIQTIQASIEKLKKDALDIKAQLDEEPNLINALAGQNKVLADYEIEIKKVQDEAATKISDIAVELSTLKSKVANIEKDVENDYFQRLNAFNSEKNAITQSLTENVNLEKDVRNTLKMELNTLKGKKEVYESSIKMRSVLESKITKQAYDLQTVNKDILVTNQHIAVAKESKRLIKSYSLQKFQETLDSIGETASDILRNVPNMTTASIYFEGCKETNSGTVKEEVTAFINLDGEPDVDIKSLSGGERTAADLAVDLAVIDVLEVKAGKGADFFILDEPFDGLDSPGKAAIVDLIKGIDSNKRIIIVDHGAETKEIISDKIIAVRSGDTSCVV
jgi:DNA repair exonuclease SbcCD ATPase subunit